MGEWVAEKWQFPPRLAAAIRMHHTPGATREGGDLVNIVHVADILARALGIGSGGDARIPQVSAETWDNLDLGPRQVDQVVDDLLKGYAKAGDFLELLQS